MEEVKGLFSGIDGRGGKERLRSAHIYFFKFYLSKAQVTLSLVVKLPFKSCMYYSLIGHNLSELC